MNRNLVITTLVALLATTAFAQVYEKESETALKVTASVSTVYNVAKIKERIVDLGDYIKVAQAQIITYEKQIAELEGLLLEADKVGIKDAISISPIKEEPIEEEIEKP